MTKSWITKDLVSTHWGRVAHKCVSKLTIIGSDNGLSPGRRQAIIWTDAGILLIGPLGTNFSEILIEIYTFSFRKIHLKVSSGKWQPSCLGLNVLNWQHRATCFVSFIQSHMKFRLDSIKGIRCIVSPCNPCEITGQNCTGPAYHVM